MATSSLHCRACNCACAPWGGHTGTSHHRRCGADGEKLVRRSRAYTQLKGPRERQGAQTNTNCLLPTPQPANTAHTCHHHQPPPPRPQRVPGRETESLCPGSPPALLAPRPRLPHRWPTGRLPGALVGRKGRGHLSGSREQARLLACTGLCHPDGTMPRARGSWAALPTCRARASEAFWEP